MISESVLFLESSAGQIVIRLLCVSFIGLGANLFIQRVFERLELYEKPRTKAKLQIMADLLSYAANIGLSIMVSIYYDKHNQYYDSIVEGVFFGLGALAFQYIFSSGGFLNFIKVWRKK